MSTGLEIVVKGRRQKALATSPDLTSCGATWNGFILEQHPVQSFEMPDHWVPYYLVVLELVEQTSKRFLFEGGRLREETIQPKDCVVVAPQEVRRFRAVGNGRLICVSIEPIVLQSIIAGSGNQNPFELVRRWNGDDPVLRSLVFRLHAEVAAGSPAGPILGESICTQLAEELIKRYSIRRCPLDDRKGGLSGSQLRRTLEYIDGNLNRALTTDAIAHEAGLSKYHFGKAFKQSTGDTLHNYVLSRRMWRSRDLLVKSDLPLVDIAEAVGFSHQSHFTSVFSTRIGITPAAYRAMGSPVAVSFHMSGREAWQRSRGCDKTARF